MNIDNRVITEILSIIKILNKKKEAIQSSEISEQESNITDYEKLLGDILVQTQKIEKIQDNNDEVIEELLLLRIKILDIIWHYEQLDELLLKLITKYDFVE